MKNSKKRLLRIEDEKGLKEEILTLEKKIEELSKRMPAHSVPVEMMQGLDDLEDKLSAKKRKLNNSEKDEMSKSP